MRTWAALLMLCAVPLAHAQATPYDGEWKARFKAFGQDREAHVVLKGQGGTWQTLYLPQGADICARLEAPIEVLESTPQHITFVTRRARMLAGCTDGQPTTFQRVDEKTLEGVLANGSPIRLSR